MANLIFAVAISKEVILSLSLLPLPHPCGNFTEIAEVGAGWGVEKWRV